MLSVAYVSGDSVFVIRSERLHLRFSALCHNRILAHLERTDSFSSHGHATSQNWRSGVVLIVLSGEF